MTENEYLSLLSNLREEATVQIQFFVAVFSAYVLVIYVQGKKLSGLSLTLLTITYSLFITVPMLACTVAVSNISAVAASYATEHPDAIVEHVLVPMLPVYNVLLLVLCWLLSIGYMLITRRSR